MTWSEVVQKGYDKFLKNHQDIEYVVRCKDCNFYTADERWCRRLGLCGAFDADGFCSHGERKETEDE